MKLPARVDVLVAGGGPCGLMLVHELGRRGVTALLVDDKPDTAFNPQANATQARTMEHFRRLGFADEIRAQGLPPDFPTDIAYFTRFADHELARFALPSARQAKASVSSLGGSWSAAELPHRVSQKFVEATMKRHAQALPGITLRYGWRLAAFTDTGTGIEARIEQVGGPGVHQLSAGWLMGADGPRSLVRQQLGIRYGGETGVQRDFMGGRMYAIYADVPDFYQVVRHPPAWMNVSFNGERRAFMAAVDGRREFAFHTQLHPHEDEARLTETDAQRMFQQAVGRPLTVNVLSRGTWTAGHCLVADSFGRGRVFIGGDAAHLFTPTGGLGYNTAIEDAVNLGWKLAAVIRGQAPDALLDSYGTERRAVALRNTGYARGFADSLGLFKPVPDIEADTDAGRLARRHAGDYLAAHGRAEFNIPGITFGGRYDGSPVIAGDGSTPPPDSANRYQPSGCPGGRAPHAWLADGSSLFDHFGFDWTLLQLGDAAAPGTGFAQAAGAAGLSLKLLEPRLPGLRELYGADLALVRPDQVVAWRGNHDRDAAAVLARVTGRG